MSRPLISAVLAVLYLERGDEPLDLFDKLLRYVEAARGAPSTSNAADGQPTRRGPQL